MWVYLEERMDLCESRPAIQKHTTVENPRPPLVPAERNNAAAATAAAAAAAAARRPRTRDVSSRFKSPAPSTLRLGVAHLHTSQGPQVRPLNWCQREPTQPRGTAHRHQPHRHARPRPLVRPHHHVHPRPHVRPHRHVRPHLYMIHL